MYPYYFETLFWITKYAEHDQEEEKDARHVPQWWRRQHQGACKDSSNSNSCKRWTRSSIFYSHGKYWWCWQWQWEHYPVPLPTEELQNFLTDLLWATTGIFREVKNHFPVTWIHSTSICTTHAFQTWVASTLLREDYPSFMRKATDGERHMFYFD